MLQVQLNFRPSGSQRGASLIVSLILLAVIALLVVYGAQPLLTEQKIASNQNDRTLAFQLAELGLKSGEGYVAANKPVASAFATDCSGGLCLPSQSAGGSNAWERSNVFTGSYTNSLPCSTCTITADTMQKPRYTIELLDSNYSDAVTGTTGASLYRITSRAWGRNANTQVTLQSYYVVS
jgi:type IV pilus assembly protein PilX